MSAVFQRLRTWWSRRGLEPNDPDTPEWHDYRRQCRVIARRNAGPGGYQAYPRPPGCVPRVPEGLRNPRMGCFVTTPELHGMTHWVAFGHRYDEPGQPEIACVVDRVIRAQSDCEVCRSNEDR